MIEYLLKARGKKSVRDTIQRAHAETSASNRATLKSAAYGKLEMLIDLDLITVRDADALKREIDAIPMTPPVSSTVSDLKPIKSRAQGSTGTRCLTFDGEKALTASEINALIASGYIKPIPRTETAPVITTITAAWQGNEKE